MANWLTTASNAPSANGRCHRIALPPIDPRLDAPRHREHAVVEVDAGHVPVREHARQQAARQHPGAACDVEDAVARPDLRDLGDDGRPLGEQRRDEVPLVGDGGTVGQLPGFLVGHGLELHSGGVRRCLAWGRAGARDPKRDKRAERPMERWPAIG